MSPRHATCRNVLLALVFACTLHCVLGAAARGDRCREVLLEASSWGRLDKQGVLDPGLWFPSRIREVQERWRQLAGVEAHTARGAAPLPPRDGCHHLVLISDRHKLIFLKTPRTGSGLVSRALGVDYARDGRCKASTCLRRVLKEEEGELESKWRSYWVFTVTRNPFDRAAGLHQYLPGLWRKDRPATCRAPGFREFAERPFLLGLHSEMHECVNATKRIGYSHDWVHVEPAGACYRSADGRPALDYALRLSHLAEDFEAMRTQHLNTPERLASGAEPMPELRLPQGTSDDATSRNQAQFDACGQECMQHLANYYKGDFDLFAYPTSCFAGASIAKSPSTAPMNTTERLPPLDWRFYLHSHPQLLAQGIFNETALRKHLQGKSMERLEFANARSTPKVFCTDSTHVHTHDCLHSLWEHHKAAQEAHTIAPGEPSSCLFRDLMRTVIGVRQGQARYCVRLMQVLGNKEMMDRLLLGLDQRHLGSVAGALMQCSFSGRDDDSSFRAAAALLYQQIVSEKLGGLRFEGQPKLPWLPRTLPYEPDSVAISRAWQSGSLFDEPNIHFTDFASTRDDDTPLRWLVDIPMSALQDHPILAKLYKSFLAWSFLWPEHSILGRLVTAPAPTGCIALGNAYCRMTLAHLFSRGYDEAPPGRHTNVPLVTVSEELPHQAII